MAATMRIALCLTGIFWGVLLLAQQQATPGSSPEANPSGAVVTAPGKILLPKGTGVRLMATETISSKKAKPGDTFKFQVHGDVNVNDLVVIANKTTVLATVQDAHGAGMAWHAGTLAIQLGNVKLVDRQELQLEPPNALKGEPTHAMKDWAERIVLTQGRAVIFLPLSPLQHGNEAIFPKTSVVDAVTRSDALLNRADIAAAQPRIAGKQYNGDLVIVYFMPHSWGSLSPEIWCGSVKMGILHSGRKMSFTLPPGRYSLYLNGQSVPVSLQARDGGEHYLKVFRKVLPDGKPILTLHEAEHDVGELETTDAKPVKAKEAPDISKFDLAKLQAVPPATKHP